MRKKIIMVYPKMGLQGNFIKHLPLSLLYASSELVKNGVDVELLDNRIRPGSWQEELGKKLGPDVLLVGISVMSGRPIENAIEIGSFVKKTDPEIKVIWGGPHVTFFPETPFEEPSCDYAVRGYGSKALYGLVKCLTEKKDPEGVKGVYYRKDNRVTGIPPEPGFEIIDYKDIPYHLIADYTVYGHLEEKRVMFSLYSVMGCPYKCAFCSAPAFYRNFLKKWVRLPANEVVNHIEYVVRKYNAEYITFIDEDSFVDLDHIEAIIDGINRRGIRVKLSFRGARINEIKKMSDKFIEKLVATGTEYMLVGAESGSDRILRLIRKDCTVEDIINCNKKLARHPEIKVAYNFIVGIPTETLEDVKKTRDLILKLVKDNPSCLIATPNEFRPFPGTELFDLAVKEWGYNTSETLRDCMNLAFIEGDFSASWYPKGIKQFANLMRLACFFIDDKLVKSTTGSTFFYKLLRLTNRIYKPVAYFRLKYGIHHALIEYKLYELISGWIDRKAMNFSG